MRCPWLLIGCVFAGIVLGLKIGGSLLDRVRISPPRAEFVTLEIIAMETRHVEQERQTMILSIAIGGTAGLVAYDAAMRWRRKNGR